MVSLTSTSGGYINGRNSANLGLLIEIRQIIHKEIRQISSHKNVPLTSRNSLTNFSHNIASSISRLSGIQTHNVSCDRH
jgi:hypothetical protein